MSSEDDDTDLLASLQRGGKAKESLRLRKNTSNSPASFVGGQNSGDNKALNKPSLGARRKMVAVKVPPVRNRQEYTYFEPKKTVERIVREFQKRGDLMYEIELTDGTIKKVTPDELLALENGSKVYQDFQDETSSPATTVDQAVQLRTRATKTKPGSIINFALSSDDEIAVTKLRQTRLGTLRKRDTTSRSTTRSRQSNTIDISSSESVINPNRRRKRKVPQKPTRRSSRGRTLVQVSGNDESEDESDDDTSSDLDIIIRSNILSRKRKRGRPSQAPEKLPRTGTRHSERATRARNNMQEANIDDIYRSDSEPKQGSALRIVNVKETFETLPRTNSFRLRHAEGCEVCYQGPKLAPLIYCQGCCLAYHKDCLGVRATRDHLVTKVADDKYVLQCRRCINIYQKKDATAPDLSMCQDCRLPGLACKPFRPRKTAVQEQKERDENDGQDPVVDVPLDMIDNARNVLFRCTKCSRAYHYHHLPPLSSYAMDISRDEDQTADERFQEYSTEWLCRECGDTKTQKVSSIVAWRPSDVEKYPLGTSCYMVAEDDKQYLIKWEGQSYLRVAWFSGAWTWGVTAVTTRKAFFKREDGPKMRTEDAIPEEFLRIDIVLDIKYTSHVAVSGEEILKARIKEVDEALIKYKGLGYEDAVWETVPSPEDGDRWLDFVTAYNDWVAGHYVKFPKQGPLKSRLEKARSAPFAKLEKKKQPENLVGGELMKYQMKGLNWLYYQWHSQKNGILADEMGLGKTIQVIAFMATLIEEHNCFPFLVVVPNSTCANWRREIKQWVPSLRVVTFFGSAAAREMALKYEMFPEGSKELRAHIVVTSYEAATDDSCRRTFRNISWAGLIVDEGQRLKNDKSQLYNALASVNAPFKLLLTGTPLQNNTRELLNLLQFLDETIKAAELEEKYADMTAENVRELHDQIRPFILRRTKAQVLTFLPPLGQVILPISMSHLQKNLYKSILAKNPELLKALFTTGSIKAQERANLSNILMQLRKCLCHPFVYSREIEEHTDIAAVSHRNLVEASAKLQLLELLLPKLKERGHRVLIFSQFLDMLNIIEDFMDGMQMAYQRLDGTMGSLEKQKRIDQFNAPDSPLFAFLLSTRAGGVGINLATADTVIILDPDFNPHQDIQAISRAHRIGQKKKVLCFQLMTRASVEEKIVQMGRNKMALDHVVVEQLGAEDMEDKDVDSILKFGAAELFKDDNADHDIRYDDASIDKLLDRSRIENTKTSGDESAESQFSFARVWANDQGALEDSLGTAEEEVAPDPGVWDKILKERQAIAAAEALARADALGRGKRVRTNVDYATEGKDIIDGVESVTNSPVKLAKETQIAKVNKRSRKKKNSEDDTDFQVEESEDHESGPDAVAEAQEDVQDLKEIDAPSRNPSTIVNKSLFSQNAPATSRSSLRTPVGFVSVKGVPAKSTPSQPGSLSAPRVAKDSHWHSTIRDPLQTIDLTSEPTINRSMVKPFVRVQLPVRSPLQPTYRQELPTCLACHKQHPRGACELKAAGVEHCGLCGLAHFGHGRTCPHIRSETQVREMLQALRNSPEKKELVDLAIKYLRGVKGHLVQAKKIRREKAAAAQAKASEPGSSSGPSGPNSAPLSDYVYQPPEQAGGSSTTHGPHASYPHQNQPSSVYQGLPWHDVPPPYHGPVGALPGSVGTYLTGQEYHIPAVRQQQQQQQQNQEQQRRFS